MTENLISPHGFGDMWHVTGPGESWFYDEQGHQFFLNFRDKTVYLTLRATGRALSPSCDTHMSPAETAARTIRWHQVREAVLGTPSGSTKEKISKVSGEEGPVVDRRKAERALHQLQAELLQKTPRQISLASGGAPLNVGAKPRWVVGVEREAPISSIWLL